MQLFLFIAVVILVAFGILTVQNPANVMTLKFIIWEIEKPLAIVLAVPFAAGLLAGIFLFIPTVWKKSGTVRSHKKRIQELERELSSANEQLKVEKPDTESGGYENNN
jgi:uncharacterized integral membrane protein